MCRAIWALAVGPDDDACGSLRRAAGADVQVVAMATSLTRIEELLADTPIDIAIIDANTNDAYGILSTLRRSYPKIAVVWVGADAPATTHASVPPGELDADHLPSAVTRALIARK